jgi:hypothetical protein
MFWRWLRQQGTYDGYNFYYTPDGSLFTYEIGQNWLDLRCQAEIPGGAHINWWQNSKLAILAEPILRRPRQSAQGIFDPKLGAICQPRAAKHTGSERVRRTGHVPCLRRAACAVRL